MNAPAVTAIVVAWNSAEMLPACLDALGGQVASTIVVDNASGDDSAAVAAALGAGVIASRRNEGYGRANNIGIAATETPFALICNPDCVLDEGAVAELVAAAARYPDAALLAPRVVEADGRVFLQARSLLSPYLTNPKGIVRLPEGDCCLPFLSGACLLVRREMFLAVGGFDENIFLFYEDDDLCRRLADAGHALVHVDTAVARHGRGKSAAPRPGRVFRTRWHQAWSRAYVSRKWGLPDPAAGMAAENALKAGLSCLTLRRALIERYGGSMAGALGFLRGESALDREGLSEVADVSERGGR